MGGTKAKLPRTLIKQNYGNEDELYGRLRPNVDSEDDFHTCRLSKRQSQPTTVLLRTTPPWTINQLQTLTHLGHNQQQSFLGLHSPGRSTKAKLLYHVNYTATPTFFLKELFLYKNLRLKMSRT